MAGVPDTTTAGLVGGAAALVTTLFSKWLDSRTIDRRDAQDSRREHDRKLEQAMIDCEKEKELLRDKLISLQLENATMRAMMIANHLEMPKFLTPTVL